MYMDMYFQTIHVLLEKKNGITFILEGVSSGSQNAEFKIRGDMDAYKLRQASQFSIAFRSIRQTSVQLVKTVQSSA